MDNYSVFANFYDILMNEVPYEEWVKNIKKIWSQFNFEPKLVLDLACGTGTITNILAEQNYDMIGIDLSYEMLMEANAKKTKDILYLNQNMSSFELYGTVDSIICLCDSLNYLVNEDDILKTFKLVNNYLNPNGLFIFDVNTDYKFKNILGNNTYSGNYNEFSYIWENSYDEKTKINEYLTTFFVKNNKNKMYEKTEELHVEKAYSIEELTSIISKSGLELLDVYDEEIFKKPTCKSQRIYFVCKENGKDL